MMAAILKSAIFDSAILYKKNFTHSFWLNLMMAAILNSAIMDSDTAIWIQKTSLIHSLIWSMALSSWTLPTGFSHLHKKTFTHSFWLNLMMAAILNSARLDSDTAILDSDTLLSFLRFTQKHSHSICTQTKTSNSFHSHSTWWWQPSWILPSWIFSILDSHLSFSLRLLTLAIGSHYLHKKTSLVHSDSTWWWQPSWILPCLDWASAILDSDTLLSSLRFTQKHSHSILTLTQTNSIWLKLIHSHLTWWWQPSWTLPGWIQILPSWIQTPCYLLSDSLKNTLTPFWLWLKLIQSDSNSFILT